MTMDNNVRTVLISYLILSLVEAIFGFVPPSSPRQKSVCLPTEPRAPFSARAVLPAALPNLR